MKTCKCNQCSFEYQNEEGVISQEITDHMKTVHAEYWAECEKKLDELFPETAELKKSYCI